MTDRGAWDAVVAESGAFDRLVTAETCPPPGLMLLVIAAEFRPCDPAPVSFRLDELARELFAAAAPASRSASARPRRAGTPASAAASGCG